MCGNAGIRRSSIAVKPAGAALHLSEPAACSYGRRELAAIPQAQSPVPRTVRHRTSSSGLRAPLDVPPGMLSGFAAQLRRGPAAKAGPSKFCSEGWLPASSGRMHRSLLLRLTRGFGLDGGERAAEGSRLRRDCRPSLHLAGVRVSWVCKFVWHAEPKRAV
eukprot:366251-Chlamydomonas_euryale.AAC.12